MTTNEVLITGGLGFNRTRGRQAFGAAGIFRPAVRQLKPADSRGHLRSDRNSAAPRRAGGSVSGRLREAFGLGGDAGRCRSGCPPGGRDWYRAFGVRDLALHGNQRWRHRTTARPPGQPPARGNENHSCLLPVGVRNISSDRAAGYTKPRCWHRYARSPN